jgi:hypothetical protein
MMNAGEGGGNGERQRIAAIAKERLKQVDEKLQQLTTMRAHLQSMCDNALPGVRPKCPATRLESS